MIIIIYIDWFHVMYRIFMCSQTHVLFFLYGPTRSIHTEKNMSFSSTIALILYHLFWPADIHIEQHYSCFLH
ncbi:hypothetical protein ACJX0J_019528, partial [Zea mays]